MGLVTTGEQHLAEIDVLSYVRSVRAARTDLRGLAAELFARPGRPRRPPLIDVILAGVFVALTVVEAVSFSGTPQATRLWAFSVPALATLAVRRQYPLLVACVVTNVNFVVNAQNQFTTLLSLVLVAFTV